MIFCFAWVTQDEMFHPLKHMREDEQVFSLEILQNEGEVSQCKSSFG
jgi:hypothetical protein